MFHVELRQFPHSARAFNLSLEELRASFLSPWVAGRTLEWAQRQWAPDRAKLTVYEGPELRPDELGMGRGWANAARGGEEVTARVLAEEQQTSRGGEPLQALKLQAVELCAARPLRLAELPGLAEVRWPQLRASERLALAEQAVWELLHERRVTLVRELPAGRDPIAEADWQASLLAWASWTATATATATATGTGTDAVAGALTIMG
ncbi:MAG: hypothetical protein QOD66_375 [Solirubrobacteraceae bacterium]|nr:hypothetical protein [Solirubrobacteraceae bacterium]